jgi:hypothetical protein
LLASGAGDGETGEAVAAAPEPAQVSGQSAIPLEQLKAIRRVLAEALEA